MGNLTYRLSSVLYHPLPGNQNLLAKYGFVADDPHPEANSRAVGPEIVVHAPGDRIWICPWVGSTSRKRI
jgi:hypothetical protein